MSDELLIAGDEDCPRCVDLESAPLLESLLGYAGMTDAEAATFRMRHKDHLAICPFCGDRFEIASRRRQKVLRPIAAQTSVPWLKRLSASRWVKVAVAACLVLSVGILAIAQQQLKKQLTEEQRELEATKDEARAFVPIHLAWDMLRQSSQDRRKALQPLLQEAIDRRNALPAQIDRDHIDAEIRSVFAASLAFPTVRIAADDLLDKLYKFDDAAFVAHPTAINPDATGLAIAFKTKPRFWKRGTKPDWVAKLTKDDFVVPGELSPRIEYSPDGNRLAFAPQLGGGLTLWDRECSEEKRRLIAADGPGSVVLAVGFSPDSSRLFAVRGDGTIPSWKLPSYEADKEWSLSEKPAKLVAARFSADNAWLAIADEKHIVALFGADGKKVAALDCGEAIEALAWSPDNRSVAVGFSSGSISAFGRNGIRRDFMSSFNFGKAFRLQFSPDGQYLHAGALGQGGRVFNAQTGERLGVFDYGIWSFSNDGRWFSASDSRDAAFVEFIPPTAIRRIGGLSRDIVRIAWSKDSRRVVTLDAGFVIQVLDVTRPNPLVSRFAVEPNDTRIATMSDVALSDDGKQFFYARGGQGKTYACVFDAETGKELPNSRWELPGGFDRAASAGAGRFLSVREEVEERTDKGTKYKTVARVFEVGKKDQVSERTLRKSQPTDVGGFIDQYLTGDGKHYAWSGPRKFNAPGTYRVEIIDTEPGAPERKPIPVSGKGGSGSVLASPDGKRLWYNATEERVEVMDVAAGRTSEDSRKTIPFAVAQGTDYVAREGKRTESLRQLNLAHWPNERAWLHVSNPDLSAIRGEGQPFSPDGRYLAFGSSSGLLTIVDMQTLEKEIAEIEKKLQKVGQ